MNKKDLGFFGIIFAACMIAIHTVFTLAGFLTTEIFSNSYQGEISSKQTMQDLYVKLAQSSAEMNTMEIVLWVVIPSLLLIISLISINQKKSLNMLLIGLLLSMGIFCLAYGSNQIDATIRKKIFSSVVDPQKALDEIRYPHTSSYVYEYKNYYDAVYNTYTYLTNDSKENVIDHYLSREFSLEKENSSIKLIKENAFVGRFRYPKTIYLDIMAEGAKTKVVGKFY